MLKAFIQFITLVSLTFSYQLKAEDNSAFKSLVMFQALKYVDWSTTKKASKPLNFCSLTQNEHSAAHTLALKKRIKSGQHIVYFNHFYRLAELSDFNLEFGCDIYYFDNLFSQLNIRQHLATAVQQNSLSIGNSDTFLLQNGTMAFIEKSGKTVLQINPHQAVIQTNDKLASFLDISE